MKRSTLAGIIMAGIVASTVARDIEFNSIDTSPTNGLVAWLSMQHSGTVVYDEMGINHATADSGVVFDTTYGHVRTGAYLPLNTKIAVPDNPSLDITDTMTVCFWYRSKYAGTWDRVITKLKTGSFLGTMSGWEVQLKEGKLNATYGCAPYNAYTVVADSAVSDKTAWHYYCAVIDSRQSSIRLYVDGHEVNGSGSTYNGMPAQIGVNANPIWINAVDWEQGPYYSTGDIDEVRIYNRVLSSGEVLQLYNNDEGRYVVTFDPQGGEVNPTNKTVTFDAAYGELPEPARTGYTFTGWTGSTNGGAFSVASDTVVAVASDHTLAATWAANDYTATFDAAGGSVDPSTKTVTYGAAYGALPVPALAAPVRVGYIFGGWFTGANGAGARITDAALVAEASNHTLYAKWTAEPYVCEQEEEEEDAPGAVGSYDGYFYGEKEFNGAAALSVRGTLTLKVTGPAGRLTAKASLQTGTLSFSAKAWTGTEADGSFRAVLAGKGGETFDLRVRQGRVWGTLANGSLGGETLTLDGGLNRFADRADAGAPALLESFKGYYTVALPLAEEGVSASGEVGAAPRGVGYLTVTVGNRGSAKIAGVLADGTQVSRSSRLILFGGCGPEACVPFFAPLYMKTGWSGGLLWLTPSRGKVVTDRDFGWFVRWEKPGAGPDGFSELLDACGGFYGTGAALASAYLFSAEVGDVPYHAGGGEAAAFAALPEDVEVAAAGDRLTIAKGARPVKVAEEGDARYEYDEANPTSATLSYAAKTGIFKGKFSLYYDYHDAAGRLQHKTVPVPYAGVLTPVRDAAFAAEPAGMGHCLVQDNDPAVKAYRIKRSFPVRLDAAQ